MNVAEQIERFEGRRCQAYRDTLGKWTIGVGHCSSDVHEGAEWTDSQVSYQLARDIENATLACRHMLPWFDALNEPRQAVLIGMAFQLGITGLLGFHGTLDAIRDEHFADAAEHMRQSKWAQQTPNRVRVLAAQMDSGEWQA